MIENTIVAQATSPGKNGISVIRISGKKSLEIAKKIFVCKNFLREIKPNFMYLGHVDLFGILDKCFCVYYKAPHSYTGEDVIEFQCHGGYAVSNRIIKKCLENGAKIAEPGEFSKRAFLNGKLSLDEAEGIVETINAETEEQLKAGNNLAKGKLFKFVNEKQEQITNILAEIDVNLDYPEHDIEYETKENIKKQLENILNEINSILLTEQKEKIIKNGINVAIVGKTNVGKSSLLNALINYDKAIVTDVAGTTRDVVDASIEYKGLKINFYDTAGIRKTSNKIEEIGIEKAKSVLKESDVVLFVFDASKPLDKQDEENLKLANNSKKIVVFNKSDLNSKITYKGNYELISAKNNTNVEKLKEKIYSIATKEINFDKEVLINARHIEILKESKNILENAIKNINNVSLDCVSLDVENLWNKLGEITGNTANEEIINRIFSKFCLGK